VAVGVQRAESGERAHRRIVSPPREELARLKTPLNESEQVVFDFFDTHLAPEWEIYVQPHLNGLRPDFVLLNPKIGIAVFEVKGWNLDSGAYSISPTTSGAPRLSVKTRDGRRQSIENPIEKLHLYRSEIAQLYCPGLDQRAGLAAVTAGLVIPTAPQAAVAELLGPALDYRIQDPAVLPYFRLVGADLLSCGTLDEVFPDARRASSHLMTSEIADDLRHWLVEPDFAAEQRDPPFLNQQQLTLVNTRTESGYRRIRGPAGSGKTMVLAGRAAALEREGKDVLVVAYNHTLLNYLRDSAVRFGCDSRRITWLTFHSWCKRVMAECGRIGEYDALFHDYGDFDDEQREAILATAMPELVERTLRGPAAAARRYDAVLVDEAQDMLPEWWAALRHVVKARGEMVLVADVAQDVYDRRTRWTERAMTGAGFTGKWVDLDYSYRMPTRLTELARHFVETYLPASDSPLPNAPAQQELDVDVSRLRWIQVAPARLAEVCADAIAETVVESRTDGTGWNLAFADVVFLCDRISDGRAVSELLRERGIRIAGTYAHDSRERTRQKRHFFKGDARVKGTTIHSFKGWEGRSLVIGVGAADSDHAKSLVYSGMTRLKAHPRGSYLTIVCAAPELAAFGALWPEKERRV
jgi:AAA domain/Nuclease-related domain